ncbi:MAG: hypothetical protein ENTB_02921 [Enterocloster aldenensis]
MKAKLLKGVLTVLSLICILCIPVTPIYAEPQGTDGTEMQVMEPEKLEIQLGADWADVEFQLKTDSGLYPGTIAVGEDGVLRMELGGSKSYVLTCMNSSVSAPEATQAPATTEEAQNESNEGQDSSSNNGQDEKGTVAGIPILHLVLFAGGMVLAVGSLVAMRVMKKRRESDAEYEDEDEYEDD